MRLKSLPWIVVIVASWVACLPLSGCSPATTPNVDTNGGPSVPVDQTADVLVVGAGISGLSTALDLGRGGARVTVIDMSSVFGGHAVMKKEHLVTATTADKK